MAFSDLDHIRALLIAQTEDARPRTGGLFGRARADTPVPTLSKPLTLASQIVVEPELLLETVAAASAQIEVASPLPPPLPRDAFGRRKEVEPEPAPETQTLRRLKVLDDTGSAVGEMIILADDGPFANEAFAAPYFPEDFNDRQGLGGARPLRPWITALRNSGLARKPAQDPRPDGSLCREVRRRRGAKRAAEAPPPSLGRDLMEALAISLSREHEALADRLHIVAGFGQVRQARPAEAA